jgi:pimeloyl-ACP methyl ester carboxylesterase
MNTTEFAALKKTVDTPFGTIAYAETGTADAARPPALFVHGVLLNGALWRNVMEPLASDRRCIAVDLMGHGDTRVSNGQDLSFAAQAKMLEAFLDALAIDQVDLIGNDSGGGIVTIFAADNPHRIRTLTLTNCDTHDNVFPEAVVPLLNLMKAGGLAPAFKPLLDNVDAVRKSFATAFETPDAIDAATFDAYLRPTIALEESSKTMQRWAADLKAADLSRVTPKLKDLKAPALVIWGTADVFFDVKWAYWLKDNLGGPTEVIEIPGAKLFFPEERPQMLADEIRDFWAAHTPALTR